MRILLLYIFIIFIVSVKAQVTEWQTYNVDNSELPDNQVQVIEMDDNNVKWFGTTKGMARFDGSIWTIFNTGNSGIPSNSIYTIKAFRDEVWIGTGKGLAKYDGSNWTVFNNKDSVFLSPVIIEIDIDKEGNFLAASELNLVKFKRNTWEVLDNTGFVGPLQSLAVDSSNHIWVGDFDLDSHQGILWEYDGTEWTPVSLRQHDELISSFPYALAVDKNNILWMGTGGTPPGALVRIEENNWSLYRYDNAGISRSGIQDILIEDDTKWLATGEGLINFREDSSIIYNKENSGLPDNWVYSITIDKLGNKWLGIIGGGAVVFKSGGIITSAETEKPEQFVMLSNYPNPFNSSSRILYYLEESAKVNLSIINILGETVAELFNGVKSKGEHEVVFNASGLPAGIYFCRMEAVTVNANMFNQSVIKMSYLK